MKRILLIDDVLDVQSLVANILRNRGAVVDAASNGHQASELLRKKDPYDLIITDLNMPIEDGFSIIFKARNTIPNYRSTPIIVITAGDTFSAAKSLDYDKSIKAIEQTRNLQIVKKPFSKSQLLDVVAKMLGVTKKEEEDLWFGDDGNCD